MLKDYYYSSVVNGKSTLMPSTIKAIESILAMQAAFSTYGRYRSYCKRVQSDGKCFLWHGFYYEVTDECKNELLCLLKVDRQSQEDDLHFKAYIDYTSNELARDGVEIPKNLFDEVKK